MTAPAPDIGNQVHLEGHRKRAVETARSRLLAVAGVLAAVYLSIAGRLVDLTLLHDGQEPRRVLAHGADGLRTGRADVTDRRGRLLATNLLTASLFADPQLVPDPAAAAARLARVLPELDEAAVVARLGTDSRFVWLRRHLTPDQQYEVNRLGIPGLDFQREERRVYPMGRMAAHVLGFTDADNRGLTGIERYFDEALRTRDEALALALDVRAQHALQDELALAKRRHRAIGAAGIVLDARTGEVVAMASLPDFDPNRPHGIDDDALFNRTTLGVYEMGSTFKIFNTAMALDGGVATLASGYDATHPIRISRYAIRDYHAKRRRLSVPEIFVYSSNIGSAKMALAAGGERQRAFLGRLGLLRRPEIELPEIGLPLAPARWGEVSVMTIAFGHGLAVSPLQLVAGVAAVVNGGVLRPPTLIRRPAGRPVPGTRILSAATSDKMRRLMRLVVRHGTGRRAAAKGYMVGGKTGTAEKAKGGRYRERTVISSFVAAFPIQDPRFVVFAMIDEAKPTAETHGYVTGGWVAAPVVRGVIERIAPLLGVPPVDESDDALRRRMAVPAAPGAEKRLASF